MTIHRTPRRGTPRKRVPPNQTDYVIIDKPSGHCPKCRKYVCEKGVECIGCNAFWHYTCANVTQKILDEKWDGVDWFCKEHETHHALSLSNEHVPLEEAVVKIRLKVNSYTLNPKSTIRKLKSSINSVSKIEVKDSNQQYYLKLCRPTFEILVANMIDLGDQWGLSIKAGSVDNKKGNNVGAQFNLNLFTPSGVVAQTSVNCFPTNSSIHIQLNKSGKESGDWNEKVKSLSNFIYQVLAKVIEQIERSPHFEALRESMLQQMVNIKDHESGSLLKVEFDSTVKVSEKLLNTAENISDIDNTQSSMETTMSSQEPTLKTPRTDETSCKALISSPDDSEAVHDQLHTSSNEAHLVAEDAFENGALSEETTLSPGESLLCTEDQTDHSNLSAEKDMGSLASTEDDKLTCTPALTSSLEQKSIDSLRMELSHRNEEIKKMTVDLKLFKKLQTECEEKSKEIGERDNKITKIMNMKDQLGEIIESLKRKLSESEAQALVHSEKISAQEEVIQNQIKTIKELNLRTECNREVATLFMDEVLNQNDEGENEEVQTVDYKEQIAKLFNDLSEAQNKIDQCQLRDDNASSEIAALKLIQEEDEKKHKSVITKKDKELKSLKNEILRLEEKQVEIKDALATSEKKGIELGNILELQKCKNEKLETELKKAQENLTQLQNQISKTPPPKVTVDVITQTASETVCNKSHEEKVNLGKQLKVAMDANKQLKLELEGEKKRCTDIFLESQAAKSELSAVRQQNIQITSKQPDSVPVQELQTHDSSPVDSVTPPQPSHLTNVIQELGNICYKEAAELGSCPRGNRCRFSHNIPPEMRSDDEFSAKVANAKEEKAAKCVNEFFRPGSCRKGMACRFSHKISMDHRNDPTLRKSMEEKFQWLTGRNSATTHSQRFDETMGSSQGNSVSNLNFPRRGQSSDDGPLSVANQSPQNNVYHNSDGNTGTPQPLMKNLMSAPTQVQHGMHHPFYPQPSYEMPQSLMQQPVSAPAQVQVISLLQNLLAQMINVDQINSQQYTCP